MFRRIVHMRAGGSGYLDGPREVPDERNGPGGDKDLELVEQGRFTLRFRPSPK